jgi:hypothetical protein
MLLLGGEAPPTPCPNQYQKKRFQGKKVFIVKKKTAGVTCGLVLLHDVAI